MRLLRCLFMLAFALALDAQISRSRWVYVGPLSGIPATCDPLAGAASFITNASAGGQVYLCGPTINTWTRIAGSGGTVTITGTPTAAAIVTSAGGNAIQTPSATTTLDSSGNLS